MITAIRGVLLMSNLLGGRYKRLRDVPEYKLVGGVLPGGLPRSGRLSPAMDRGLLNVAVQAYANVKGIDYELAHQGLSR